MLSRVLCQFCQKNNKFQYWEQVAIYCSVNVIEEIEFCNFLKCHSTPLKRVQHQVLIQLESFWPNRSFICQKLISSGNSRFLTCCENIWPPRSCSYLSTNFSLGLTFVSLIRKDCTRSRVTQRDEQSNKLLNQNSQMEESQMQWFLVIQCWFWRIYVQFCWLEDYVITMIFFSPAVKWISSFLCANFFLFLFRNFDRQGCLALIERILQKCWSTET